MQFCDGKFSSRVAAAETQRPNRGVLTDLAIWPIQFGEKSISKAAMAQREWQLLVSELMAVLTAIFPDPAKLGHFADHGLEQIREACWRSKDVFASNWRRTDLMQMHLLLTSVRLSVGRDSLLVMEDVDCEVVNSRTASVLEFVESFFEAERMASIQSFYVDLKGALAGLDLLLLQLADSDLKAFFGSVKAILCDTFCATQVINSGRGHRMVGAYHH